MNYLDAFIDELTKLAADDDSSKGRAAATALGGAAAAGTAYTAHRANPNVSAWTNKPGRALVAARNTLRYGENKVRAGVASAARSHQQKTRLTDIRRHMNLSDAHAAGAPVSKPTSATITHTPVADRLAKTKQIGYIDPHTPKVRKGSRIGGGARGVVAGLAGMAATNMAHRAFSKKSN